MVHAHVPECRNTYLCVSVYVYVSLYVCLCACACLCACMYVCLWPCACVCATRGPTYLVEHDVVHVGVVRVHVRGAVHGAQRVHGCLAFLHNRARLDLGHRRRHRDRGGHRGGHSCLLTTLRGRRRRHRHRHGGGRLLATPGRWGRSSRRRLCRGRCWSLRPGIVLAATLGGRGHRHRHRHGHGHRCRRSTSGSSSPTLGRRRRRCGGGRGGVRVRIGGPTTLAP
jgi:hypothetical protein